MLDNHSISGVHLCPVFLTDRCFKPWPGDVLDISSTISCISLLGPQLVSKQFKQTWKGEGGGMLSLSVVLNVAFPLRMVVVCL